MEIILKYLTIFLLSSFKFILGPSLGLVVYKLSLPGVILMTALGMMNTVYLFVYFLHYIRKFQTSILGRRKKFTKRNRKFVKLWGKYGTIGISLLTPLLLTPIGGSLIVCLYETNRNKILRWMWISAVFWAIILCFIIQLTQQTIKEYMLF